MGIWLSDFLEESGSPYGKVEWKGRVNRDYSAGICLNLVRVLAAGLGVLGVEGMQSCKDSSKLVKETATIDGLL